jgi:hypothetical protein
MHYLRHDFFTPMDSIANFFPSQAPFWQTLLAAAPPKIEALGPMTDQSEYAAELRVLPS